MSEKKAREKETEMNATAVSEAQNEGNEQSHIKKYSEFSSSL